MATSYQFTLLSNPADREALIAQAHAAGASDALIPLETLMRAHANLVAAANLAADGSLADSPAEYRSLFIDAYTRGFLSRRS